MQFFATATALFAGLAAAAPSIQQARDEGHGVKYVGLTYSSPDASYHVSVPIDGGSVNINSDLSFSHIASEDPTDSATCHSYGVDKDPNGNLVVTTTTGDDEVDIGPPQVQTYVYCTKY